MPIAVYTPLHNILSIDFLNGVALETEEGLAREVSKKLDQEWRQVKRLEAARSDAVSRRGGGRR